MFEIPLWERGGVVLVSGGKHLILELADSTEARQPLWFSPLMSSYSFSPAGTCRLRLPCRTSAPIVDAMETLCTPSATTLERTELCGIPGGVFRPANLEFPQVSLLYNPGPHWGHGDLVFGPQSRKGEAQVSALLGAPFNALTVSTPNPPLPQFSPGDRDAEPLHRNS